jgi:ribosomal protein S18 acetylase RimI-like enzyme
MKLEIHKNDWNDIDLTEMAELLVTASSASPFWQPGWNLAWFQQFIHQKRAQFSPSFVVMARAQGKLVGMISIITTDPTLFDLWRWHPVVLPDENEQETAVKLIEASIHLMQNVGVHRLEVGFDFHTDSMTPETEAYYQKYRAWYDLAGAIKLDEFVYMTCEPSDFKPRSLNHIGDDFEINKLNISAKDALFECFYQAFLLGNDRSFLGRNEIQRQSMFDGYFDDRENINTAASLVLLKNQHVIGFTIFQTRPHVGDEHLALICIHPAYQGKKLGQYLLELSMVKVFAQEHQLISLGVDLENRAAYQLYQKIGFKNQSKFITHVWQAEQGNQA